MGTYPHAGDSAGRLGLGSGTGPGGRGREGAVVRRCSVRCCGPKSSQAGGVSSSRFSTRSIRSESASMEACRRARSSYSSAYSAWFLAWPRSREDSRCLMSCRFFSIRSWLPRITRSCSRTGLLALSFIPGIYNIPGFRTEEKRDWPGIYERPDKGRGRIT